MEPDVDTGRRTLKSPFLYYIVDIKVFTLISAATTGINTVLLLLICILL